MLTWIFWLLAMCGGAVIGWIAACEWYDRHPRPLAVAPDRRYADDFAEHLSGRVYDQAIYAPHHDGPLEARWAEYRDAS